MNHPSSKEEQYLRSATHWQFRPKRSETGLGQEIFSYLQQRNRAFEQNVPLVELWKSIVPPALEPYCRLDKRSGNVLYIQAQAGPYMHQVKVLSGELLERIRQAAPRCGICHIKVIPMQNDYQES